MKRVDLRELRRRLSHDAHEMRNGEVVLATEHGMVVAALTPPRGAGIGRTPTDALAELANRGLVATDVQKNAAVYPRLPPLLRSGAVTGLLDDERGQTLPGAPG